MPGSEGNGLGGFAIGLIGQAQILQRQSELLQIASGAGDLRAITNVAEGICNLIEGRNGSNYGDINGDGIVNDRGDGFGLLPGKDTPGYIQASREHARLAAAESDATPLMKEHAPHVDVAALNTSRWTGQLHEIALQLAKASDLKQAQTKISDAVALARRVLSGQDVNGNEEIEPIPDEGAARTVLQHAQFMADLPLVTPGR